MKTGVRSYLYVLLMARIFVGTVVAEQPVSSLTKQLSAESKIPIAANYSRTIPDQKAYIRVPCAEALKSLGLEKGSSVTGPYVLHESSKGRQTMSIVGAKEMIDPAVAARHLEKIQIERMLTDQAPITLFLGEVRYSKEHVERNGEIGRIHIGSSIPHDEFFAPVKDGKNYDGKTAQQIVEDVNQYLTKLYSQKLLPGALMVNGQPVNGIPVETAFGYYKGHFGSLPGAIMLRTGDGGKLADRKSVNAAFDALESIMRSAGATDFGRAFPRIRKIVNGQADAGGGFTARTEK